MSGLVTTGGDCMATASLAKPNEEQPKRLPYHFALDDVGCSVRCPQRTMMERIRWGRRTLQPLQAVVALTDQGNLNVDVAHKTPLSDWRGIRSVKTKRIFAFGRRKRRKLMLFWKTHAGGETKFLSADGRAGRIFFGRSQRRRRQLATVFA